MIKWPDGRDVRLHIAFDVTARKKAEREFRSAELRNRVLIEESPIGIAIVQNESCAYANPTLLKMLGGKTSQEVSEGSVFEAVVPEQRNSARTRYQAILAGEHQGLSHQCLEFRVFCMPCLARRARDVEFW